MIIVVEAADSEAVRCSAGSGGFLVSGVLGLEDIAVIVAEGDMASGWNHVVCTIRRHSIGDDHM